MTSKSRPTLDSLSSRFARKDPPGAPAPEIEAPASPAPAEPADPKPRAGGSTSGGRVQILTRIDPGTRKRLKMIAAEQERTIQEICEEAIRDFVARHSK